MKWQRRFHRSRTITRPRPPACLPQLWKSDCEARLERLFRLLGLKYPPKEMHAAYLALHRKKTDEYTAAIEFLDNVLERELKRILLPLLDEDFADYPDRRAICSVSKRKIRARLTRDHPIRRFVAGGVRGRNRGRTGFTRLAPGHRAACA